MEVEVAPAFTLHAHSRRKLQNEWEMSSADIDRVLGQLW
jgi:hypothetical protein